MFTRKYRLMNEAGTGEGGGEGGEGEVTIEQLQAALADANKSIEAMQAKNNELLGEKKKEAAKRRDAEAKAQAEAEAKARENGDHEQLLKSSEEARLKLQADYEKLVRSNEQKEINNAALKMAGELAEGYNAEILSESIAKRLRVSDGELKVTDKNGELTVSTLDELKQAFKGDERYASLLKGNQSSGGSASGGSNSGSAAKQKTRAEFEALSQPDRMKFTKEGGRVI